MFAACVSYAQKVDYGQRYEMLVSKFGPAGFGVETVLDNWAKADSADIKLLTARFKYYFAKAQTEQVVKKPQRKYLGMDPLITLKDSTGTDVYYYQEAMFDDEIYGPDYTPLAKVIKEMGIEPTIICESKGTMMEDAIKMKQIYDNLGGN